MKKVLLLMCLFSMLIGGKMYAQVYSNEPTTVTWNMKDKDADVGGIDNVVCVPQGAMSDSFTPSMTISDKNRTHFDVNLLLFKSAEKMNSVDKATKAGTFKVTPADGYTFTPTNISFNAVRIGTGGGYVKICVKNTGGEEVVLETQLHPHRNNTDFTEATSYSRDLSGIEASANGFELIIYLWNLDPNKEVGFGDVVISGTTTGAPAPSYAVTAASNDEDMGTVSASGKTVTASPKNGYRVSATNPYTLSPAGSATVAQDGNTFNLSDLTADCTVTINFELDPNPSVYIGPYPVTYIVSKDSIDKYNWMSYPKGNYAFREDCGIAPKCSIPNLSNVDRIVNFAVNGCNTVVFNVQGNNEAREFFVMINDEIKYEEYMANGCNEVAVPIDATGNVKISVRGGGKSVYLAKITLHKDYLVSLNAGTGSVLGSDALIGEKVTLPSAAPSAACAELGWTFAGWSTKQNDITAADLIAAGSEFTPTATTTLYAVYQQAGEEGDVSYQLVTQSDGITAGDYLFVGMKGESYYALGYQASNNRRAADVTVTDGKIITNVASVSTDETLPYQISLKADGNNWIIYDKVNDKNLGPATTGTGNNLKANDDARFSASITESGRVQFICVAGGNEEERNYLAHNIGSNNNLFACYKETTATGYPDINLYKKSSSASPAIYSTDPACVFDVTVKANNDAYGTVAYDEETKTVTYTPASQYRLSLTAPYTLTPEGAAIVTPAEDAFVLSKVSEEVTFTVNFEAYPTVANLKEEDLACDGFTATWDAATGADKYIVKVYQRDSTPFGEPMTVTTNSCEIEGLAQVSGYTFTVTAVFGEVELNPVTSELIETPTCFTGDVLVWTGAEDADWNNAANWDANSVPTATVNVKIAGNAPIFPILEEETTVNSIIIEAGAQLGNQYLLDCDTAYVNLGFNAANLCPGDWHMLSMPIGGVYTGDFSFGGHPYTYLRKFEIKDAGETTVADWTKEYQTNKEELGIGEGFMFMVNERGTTFGSKYLANGVDPQISADAREYGLDRLQGVMMFPYFDNELQSAARRVHKYDAEAKESTIYSYDYKGLLEADPAPVTILRDENSYKLAGATVTREVEFAEGANNGTHFALVGNPFVTAIDMNALYEANNAEGAENFKNSYSIWTGTGFTTYVAAIPELAYGSVQKTPALTAAIAPFQSFMIEKGADYTEGETFDVVFDNAKIDATNAQGVELRSATAEGNLLKIQATTTPDAAYAVFVAKRDNGSDVLGSADGRIVLSAANATPQIYTLKGSANGGQVGLGANVINRDDMLIPVSLLTTYTGKMSFSIDGMNDYPSAKVYFLDTATGNEIDITGMSSYTYSFNYTGSNEITSNRFFIRLAPQGTTELDETASDSAYAYAEDGQIKVVATGLSAVYVYNQQGQSLSEAINLDGVSYATAQLTIGEVYLVRIVTEAGVKTQKILVK